MHSKAVRSRRRSVRQLSKCTEADPWSSKPNSVRSSEQSTNTPVFCSRADRQTSTFVVSERSLSFYRLSLSVAPFYNHRQFHFVFFLVGDKNLKSEESDEQRANYLAALESNMVVLIEPLVFNEERSEDDYSSPNSSKNSEFDGSRTVTTTNYLYPPVIPAQYEPYLSLIPPPVAIRIRLGPKPFSSLKCCGVLFLKRREFSLHRLNTNCKYRAMNLSRQKQRLHSLLASRKYWKNPVKQEAECFETDTKSECPHKPPNSDQRTNNGETLTELNDNQFTIESDWPERVDWTMMGNKTIKQEVED